MCFKELAHWIMEAGESRTRRVGYLEVQGRVSVQVQRPPVGRTPSCWRELSLCFIQTFN